MANKTKEKRKPEREQAGKDYPILNENTNDFFKGNKHKLLFEYLRNISLQLEELRNLLDK